MSRRVGEPGIKMLRLSDSPTPRLKKTVLRLRTVSSEVCSLSLQNALSARAHPRPGTAPSIQPGAAVVFDEPQDQAS